VVKREWAARFPAGHFRDAILFAIPVHRVLDLRNANSNTTQIAISIGL